LDRTQVGDLVHGWFASWKLQGQAREADAAAYLEAEWALADPQMATWLLQISTRATESRLWPILTHPDTRLAFEHPLVGRLGRSRVVAGRADLLAQTRQGLWVVDFKAGSRSPRDSKDLLHGAGLETYAAQLEAYRAALQAAGQPVAAVVLWFVRTGAVVSW
jgi:ATP-dependent exoDNAse (exonuclease V) beta subunit